MVNDWTQFSTVVVMPGQSSAAGRKAPTYGTGIIAKMKDGWPDNKTLVRRRATLEQLSFNVE